MIKYAVVHPIKDYEFKQPRRPYDFECWVRIEEELDYVEFQFKWSKDHIFRWCEIYYYEYDEDFPDFYWQPCDEKLDNKYLEIAFEMLKKVGKNYE